MEPTPNARLEGKSSTWKWLLPLLLLLLLGAIAYTYFVTNKDDPARTVENQQNNSVATTTNQNQDQSQETQPITNVADIYTVTDTNALNGQQVILTDVEVRRVTGDKTFFIGNASTTQQVLVYLPSQTSGTGAEQAVQIKAGERRDISGTVRTLPSANELTSNWKVTANELRAIQNAKVYIDASVTTQ